MIERGTGSSPNEFEKDKPGTTARTDTEGRIEGLRRQGGVFVEAVRATRMPMAMTDPNLPGNPIVFANESFLDLSGYSMEEVLGQQPFFMNGPDTDPEDAERFREALEQDRDEHLETIQYRKDGSRFVASLFLSAFKDEAGRTVNQFLSWRDVTRRVDAEEDADRLRKSQSAVRESERRLRLVLEGIGEAFYVLDADWRFVFARRAALDLSGKSEADLIRPGLLEVFPQAEGSDPYKAHERVMASREAERLEAMSPILHRWVEANISPSADGGLSVGLRDIDARKRAEFALHETEKRIAAAFEVLPAGIAVSDATGKVIASNSVMRQFLPTQRIPSTDAEQKSRWQFRDRSEEHTSELQSRQYLVCRLLLEKKKTTLCT